LSGDILIEIWQNNYIKNEKICCFAFNTAYLDNIQDGKPYVLKLAQLDPYNKIYKFFNRFPKGF